MASQLEARVRDDIIKGHLAPGSRLRLKELADSYEVGVIPLREALSRLASSGFVSAADQKGFSVGKISAAEILDITQARLHIEGRALAEAIRLGDVEWESRVLAAHHRLDRLPMTEGADQLLKPEWELAHEAFHIAMISSCSSPTLLRLCASLRDQTSRYRSLSAQVYDNHGRDVPHEHRQLMHAVLAKDSSLACQLLADHYETTTRLVLRHTSLS